ncbi:hypothetical protein, partial [Nocardioides sp. zg-DK7169]|uniref:hypothetical protein n=1 Tax=Nocardioides sp. zg-DK7169 TaxID=2736600 RepID=UPI001C12F92F
MRTTIRPQGRRRLLGPVAVSLALACLAVPGSSPLAVADEATPSRPGAPEVSREQVDRAQAAVRDRVGDLAATRAQLALADARLRSAADAAAQASEAYNGARWAAGEARRELREARRQAGQAEALSERQRRVYADALVSSYQLAPELSALAALTESDGIASVLETTTVVRNAQEALDQRAEAYAATATVAEVSAGRAAEAEDRASASAEQARAARDAAAGAARAAAEEA